jgi:hypothetical protein
MTQHVAGDSITATWLQAVELLGSVGGEAFNLVAAISDPKPESAHAGIIAALDDVLRRQDLQPVETVAHTIFPSALFPAGLVRTAEDRARSYGRYDAVVPRLRRHRKNRRGLYFQRLIDYPLRPEGTTRVNQVETIISALQQELSRPGPLRFIYEAQVFAPGKDTRPMGFPCMSSLSFQLDGDLLRLTATYRNQYFVERALGNFLGLARLHRFVADQTGLCQGPLTVHAFHAQLDPGLSQGSIAGLIQACRLVNVSLPPALPDNQGAAVVARTSSGREG